MSDEVQRFKAPMRLTYTVTAGTYQRCFLEGMLEAKIYGKRCDRCSKVYVPPRAACPTCLVALAADVDLPQRGTVTTFCIVNIPHEGQVLEIPYVGASILLDGSDIPLFHIVGGVDVEQVQMGLRVEAVWAPKAERKPSLESIRFFRPTGEPNAPFDSFQEHL